MSESGIVRGRGTARTRVSEVISLSLAVLDAVLFTALRCEAAVLAEDCR
jgi:hypothetical protein